MGVSILAVYRYVCVTASPAVRAVEDSVLEAVNVKKRYLKRLQRLVHKGFCVYQQLDSR